MSSRHRVAVVVDPSLSSNVEELARDRHVWAVRAPETEEVAERVWTRNQHQTDGLEHGVTLFNDSSTPENSLVAILDTVELHHGEFSHEPRLDMIEVLGISVTATIRAALTELGFGEVTATEQGFVARRNP